MKVEGDKREWVSREGDYKASMKKIFTNKECDELCCAMVKIEKEGEIKEHEHKVIEVIYVLEGEGAAVEDGKEMNIKEGDMILVKRGKTHGIKNTGSGNLILFCVFSPSIF